MIYDIKIARKVAEILLEIKAVIVRPEEPFTWSSGWKSPIYCDNRLLLSYPDHRNFIRDSLKQVAEKKFNEVNNIVGVATAGIPHSALLADQLQLPMSYVRSSAKGHGTRGKIEGRLEAGSSSLVVEDLISTGGSSIKVIEALEEQNVSVAGLVAIFTYGFPDADEAFQEKNIPWYTLSDYSTLLEVGIEKDYVKESDLDSLKNWRKNPEFWGN